MRDHGTAAGAGWRTVPERGGISTKRPGVLERPSLWTWNPSRVLKGIMSKRGQEETGAWKKKKKKQQANPVLCSRLYELSSLREVVLGL